jgi:predicted anti-sigma-YlaC factor YlaD
MFAVIVLLLGGLQLFAFGVMAAFDPAALLGPLGFDLNSSEAITEARAFYGGAEIALGLLMCAAALLPRWREAGLILVAACFAGIGCVRAISMGISGAHSSFLIFALSVEVVLVVLAMLALRGVQAGASTTRH